MIRCELSEIYNSSWGILASRRDCVEAAAFGQFDKIYDAAIAEDFYSIETIAALMWRCARTATKRLQLHPVRYIEHQQKYWYHKEDADKVILAFAKKDKRDSNPPMLSSKTPHHP